MDREELLRQIEKALGNLPFPASGPEERPPLILVVEDNEVAMLQIRSALEEKGYEVRTAFGGTEALACVEKEVPDAVVLDLMMPEVDGFQVLEQIRSTSETATLPVLILTAKELTAEDRSRLKHNNIQQLIQKGAVNRNQLVACVTKLLETRTGPEPPDPAADILSESELSLTSQDADNIILIVEDNPDNLLTISAILDEAGYKYITAGDGKEAVKAAKTFHPGLILMDVQLPVLSGLDATRQIKADPSTDEIPVIGVTARAMRGDREKVLAAGCEDYLSKPISPLSLTNIIKKWMR